VFHPVGVCVCVCVCVFFECVTFHLPAFSYEHCLGKILPKLARVQKLLDFAFNKENITVSFFGNALLDTVYHKTTLSILFVSGQVKYKEKNMYV